MSVVILPHGILLAERLLLVLVDITVKSVAVFAAAGLLSLLLRRASAAQRHLVWLLALIGMLCLPLLSALQYHVSRFLRGNQSL